MTTLVMTLSTKSKCPNQRTYVLKFRSDAKPDALAGRLENLVTGRQRELTCGQELLDANAGDLDVIPAEQQPCKNEERS